LKVLHINTNSSGGAGIAAIRIHKAMLDQGIDSNILFLKEPLEVIPKSFSVERSGISFFYFRNILNRVLVKMKERFHDQYVISFSKTLFDITKIDIVKQADIIHLHWVSKLFDYPSFFSTIRKPVIWTLHDMAPFSEGYHYKLGFDTEKYVVILRKNYNVKKESLFNFKNLSITAPSLWLLNLSKDSELFRMYPHYFIRNTIARLIFYKFNNEIKCKLRHKYQFNSGDKIVLIVAENLNDKRKGGEFLVQIVKSLLQLDIKIITVGGNSPFNHTGILNLGVIKNESEMAEIYNLADVFINTSLEDNFPNTILEASSCGLPVVSFDNSGPSDFIKHKESGYLARNRDLEDLINGVKYIIDNFVNCSEKSIKQVELECSQAIVVEKFLELYSNIEKNNNQ
jgi:glycosyltransferase involved in cell wall biosynthesis